MAEETTTEANTAAFKKMLNNAYRDWRLQNGQSVRHRQDEVVPEEMVKVMEGLLGQSSQKRPGVEEKVIYFGNGANEVKLEDFVRNVEALVTKNLRAKDKNNNGQLELGEYKSDPSLKHSTNELQYYNDGNVPLPNVEATVKERAAALQKALEQKSMITEAEVIDTVMRLPRPHHDGTQGRSK